MTEPNPVTPPAEPPAPPATPPAEPKAAEKKLLDDLKKAQAKAKELESKLAEALPYVEKFKGHDEAKALEAQRQAEAAEKARTATEARNRAIRDEINFELLSQGRKVDRRGVGLIIAGALSQDSGITINEDGTVQGATEYLSSVFSTFGPAPAAEPPKKPAPGLPAPQPNPGVDQKFTTVKSFADLAAMGIAAQQEYFEKYPERYAALKLAHNQGLSSPVRVLPPAVMRSN